MGYHYRESGYGKCDYLVVTKKGMEEGRLPKGVVFLAGLRYADSNFKKWLEGKYKNNKYYIFQAKHCNDESEITHISLNGFVNRFGYFVTKTNMFETNEADYNIENGSWFTRKHASSFEEALKMLD